MVTAATLEEAITAYNEYRSPMATASLADAVKHSFAVRFEGPFCRMCCDYDYFEDLIYELSEVGVDITPIEVTEITYEGDETYLVEFSTRRSGRESKRLNSHAHYE
ncbi:hypothetical protein RBH26_05470 [Natronolimnohabitans sp. A-GB9]|uniref:hypothetical protein n=1 Tax=Natronolimnohabitans sp. A-GB9 TaxID=3069757 RepID=UPI0027B44410|nr:hypothetical protein [Natronolimnohabitans sp. A-GB9]MDQ2049928.1 hypothetical protein [Natronolimnohabitans sp. A-GB9]